MHIKIIILLVGLISLSACDNNRTTTIQDAVKNNLAENSSGSKFYPRFKLDEAQRIIPLPNNLLFAGSTDGTLNIPTDEADTDYPVKSALNTLDGFSTLGSMSATFSSAVNSASLNNGGVRLFEVTLSGIGGAVVSINQELALGSDFMVTLSGLDTTQSSLIITPRKPLKPKTSYLVVLSNKIKSMEGETALAEMDYAMTKRTEPLVDSAGKSALSTLSDEQAQRLEGIRQLANAAEIAVTTFASDLERGDIVLSWSFTTQSISDVLASVRAKVQESVAPASELVTAGDSLAGAASLYSGTIELPYYLTAPTAEDPTAPLTKYWQGIGGSSLTQLNTSPVESSMQAVPLLVSIPKTEKPVDGWPVVIFQHGITKDRTTMLAVADTLAAVGFAVVAIDMPLHGVDDSASPFYMEGKERTFNLDLINNETSAPGPDGITDSSGTHFINLSSLLTGRDNIRQAVADLFSLTKALGTMDYDGDGADFDTDNIRFIGHSLGGIAGSVFLALEPSVGAATLSVTGGGIPKLLDGSASYGPVIAAGLGANGLTKGSVEYEGFLSAYQAVLDSTDPINYASRVAEGRGVHMIEIVGGNSSLPDQVIPNNVLDVAGTVPSLFAGTDPLATFAGMTKMDADTQGDNLRAWVRFTAGHHSSLLTEKDADGNDDPVSAQVTAEIHSQVAIFLESNGKALDIENSNVIEMQ